MIHAGNVLTVGTLLAVIGAVSLATMSLTVRYGTIKTKSSDALLVTLLVNVVILVPVAFVLSDPIGQLTVRSIFWFTTAGLVGTMLGRSLQFEGIKRVGATRTEPIKASTPLHATIIAVVVLGEIVSAEHAVALVAVVIGIAIITHEHGRLNADSTNSGYVGLAFAFAAAFMYGLEPTLAKLGFVGGVSAFSGLLVKSIAGLTGIAAYRLARMDVPQLRSIDRTELPWIIGAGVANTAFLLAYYGALTLEPVSVVLPLVQTSPLLVILGSVLFVSDKLERITWRLILGAVVTVSGAITITLIT